MPASHALASLLVGPFERPEFAPAAANLSRWGPTWQVADLAEAVVWAGAGHHPDLIVVAQLYAGQLPHALLAALVERLPLAHLVQVLGSWCEGEERTGHPWPGASRLFWYEWPARVPQILAEIAEGRCSDWNRPVTATREERLLRTAVPDLPGHRRSAMSVWLATSQRNSYHALAAACQLQGYRPVWIRAAEELPPERPWGAVWDGAQLQRREQAQLREFAAAAAPARTVTILDFPRLQTVQLAARLGVAQVLSRPVRTGDLWRALDLAVGQTGADAIEVAG